jgi:glycosyltransferase involved in cell wall biosynthesis
MARIALVWEPPDGGVADHVMHLAVRLGEYGHEVEAIGPAGSTIGPRLEVAGIPVRPVAFRRGYGRPDRDLAALVDLIGIFRRRRYEIVHCHASKAGVLGRLSARLLGIPTVYTPHCFPFVGEVSRRRRWFSLAVERALGRSTARLICVCEAERQTALRHQIAPAARLSVVYNGASPCDPGLAPDAELSALREDGPVVAAVTVLRRQKALDVLLEAAPRILARFSTAQIVVVGHGPEREALESRAADLGLDREPRFRFCGFRPPAARYLKASDVFVLPSAWEAFPVGVLEAMACGLPQVATDVGGTREAVVPETGILVPPNDPAALAAAIEALLADPGRRRAAGEASVQRYTARFTVPRMVSATAAVYADVLDAE